MKLSAKEKIGYGSGDFASNLFWQTFMFFLPIFYTDVFGLPTMAAAWLFGLSRVLDAITDPTVGILADRTKSRWGRFRPYLLFGAIPFGIVGILSFTTPDMGMTAKIIYAFITYNLMMILYTVINIPYSSLLGVLTPDSQERTKVSSLRFIFAFSAGLFVTAFNNSFVNNFGEIGNTQVISKTDLVAFEGKSGQYKALESGGKIAFVESSNTINQEQIKKISDDQIIFSLNEETEITDTINAISLIDIIPNCVSIADVEIDAVLDEANMFIIVDTYNEEQVYYDGKLKLNNVFLAIEKDEVKGCNTIQNATLVSQARGYKYTITLYAVFGVLLLFFTFFSTKERVQPKAKENSNIRQDLKDLSKNIPWVLLLGAGIFTMFYVCIRNGAIAYYFKYYVTSTTIMGYDIASAFMVVGTLASIAGTGVVTFLANKFGKKQTYMGLMFLSTLCTASFFFFTADQVILMFVFHILANLFMGPTSALIWAMYADVADFSEFKTGRRATGLIFSASTMAQKIGWAIGGVITMVLLGIVGYDAKAVVQAPAAISGIKALMSVIPAFVSILCVVLVYFYTLDDAIMARVQKKMAARKV